MKKTLLFVLFFITSIVTAQIGIGTVTPNSSAMLDITSTTKGLLIPQSALIEKDQLKGVYIVTADNKALLRWVRLGKQWGDQVEVLSGLSPQDKVVTSAQGRLYNSCLIAE